MVDPANFKRKMSHTTHKVFEGSGRYGGSAGRVREHQSSEKTPHRLKLGPKYQAF